MSLNALLAFFAAIFSGSLALVSLWRRQRTTVHWSFCLGMSFLAAQSFLDGLSLRADWTQEIARWQTLSLGARSCLPAVWLGFSLVYARGNYAEFLRRWRLLLILLALLPFAWMAVHWSGAELIAARWSSSPDTGWWITYSAEARGLTALSLLASALTLANLEKTFRAAVGVMRWRIKFAVLGLGVIFGVRIYTQSQVLLFSGHDLSLLAVDAGALAIGCLMVGVAYVRQGLGEIDVYPSRAVLQSSVTVFLVGGYLFVVGVLAQIAARLGEPRNFQAQVFVVLAGVVVLVVLLLSNRLHQQVNRFVSRHFQRPQHDFRDLWTLLTRHLYEARDEPALCAAAARLVSEKFRVLSVTFWVLDESYERLLFRASTSPLTQTAANALEGRALPAAGFLDGTASSAKTTRGRPFDLGEISADWAAALRQANPRQFSAGGGSHWCVPLTTGERCVGAAVLTDRVNGVPFTPEEFDLLECIGDQAAAGLLNLRLTGDLMQAKELEAFQTMSAFFVHDLKNAASSLGLMLENLPHHFDDPEFRADALRGIGSTVGRINQLIERLGVLRRKLEAQPAPLDFNQLIEETLAALPPGPVEVQHELHPLPKVSADPEQMQSVLINLVLNAQDASAHGGHIRVETSQQGPDRAVLTVSDDGCGMSAEFMRDSLFRPFHSTKKKGLGIGMFQSKMIVEANRGSLQVQSVLGKGTVFRVSLPLASSSTSS